MRQVEQALLNLYNKKEEDLDEMEISEWGFRSCGFQKGFDPIVLCPLLFHNQSIMDDVHSRKSFRPTSSIWSIVPLLQLLEL